MQVSGQKRSNHFPGYLVPTHFHYTSSISILLSFVLHTHIPYTPPLVCYVISILRLLKETIFIVLFCVFILSICDYYVLVIHFISTYPFHFLCSNPYRQKICGFWSYPYALYYFFPSLLLVILLSLLFFSRHSIQWFFNSSCVNFRLFIFAFSLSFVSICLVLIINISSTLSSISNFGLCTFYYLVVFVIPLPFADVFFLEQVFVP